MTPTRQYYNTDTSGKGLTVTTPKVYCSCKQPWGYRTMIECNQCTEWFHGACFKLSRDDCKMYSKTKRPWYCPLCSTLSADSTRNKESNQITTKDAVKRPILKIIEGSFTCSLCGEKFVRRNALLVHMATQHTEAERKNIKSSGRKHVSFHPSTKVADTTQTSDLPGGLANPSGKNFCFINAVLQCIRMTDIHRLLQHHSKCVQPCLVCDLRNFLENGWFSAEQMA